MAKGKTQEIHPDEKDKLKKVLRDNKMSVRVQMAIAGSLIVGVLLGAKYLVIPDNAEPGDDALTTLTERLTFTIRWQVLSSTAIIHGIIGVGKVRGETIAINPSDPAGLIYTDLPKRYLTNTVEQFLIHCLAQFGITTYMDHNSIYYIPVFTFLFLIGRALFWIGYNRHPMQRVLGFLVTAFPTFFVYGCCFYCFVRHGVGFGLE